MQQREILLTVSWFEHRNSIKTHFAAGQHRLSIDHLLCISFEFLWQRLAFINLIIWNHSRCYPCIHSFRLSTAIHRVSQPVFGYVCVCVANLCCLRRTSYILCYICSNNLSSNDPLFNSCYKCNASSGCSLMEILLL